MSTLVVQRVELGRGDDPVATVLDRHRRQRARLSAGGVETVGIDPGTVLALLRTEWRAWELLGPVVGPLIAVGPPSRFRLGLAVEVPGELVLARTERPPTRRRTRRESRESAANRNGDRRAPVLR